MDGFFFKIPKFQRNFEGAIFKCTMKSRKIFIFSDEKICLFHKLKSNEFRLIKIYKAHTLQRSKIERISLYEKY